MLSKQGKPGIAMIARACRLIDPQQSISLSESDAVHSIWRCERRFPLGEGNYSLDDFSRNRRRERTSVEGER